MLNSRLGLFTAASINQPRTASCEAPLLPKLRGKFAEFLQHHSLKRLGMLYQSTCVGLGYGLYAGAVSWNLWAARAFANEPEPLSRSVTSSRPTNIDVVPIGYGCRPHLRGRLTLRGLTLRRNPWTYGGSVSHAPSRYSCQHSRFRYLQEPSRVSLHRLTERSATTLSSPQLRCMA